MTGISARVLADSIHYLGPVPRRLITFELRLPRFVLAQLNTHRALSRGAASSRAIPVGRVIEQVEHDPVVPVEWGRNQRGMQAAEVLDDAAAGEALAAWLRARDAAVAVARDLAATGAHKQIVNRILEPWMWAKVIVSATDLAHFYALRLHHAAQPEIQAAARAMLAAQEASVPVDRTGLRGVWRWHLPLVTDEERAELGNAALRVCAGRCARISYLTHDGRRDPQADVDLHDRLAADGHWSPFEHAAAPYRPSWLRRLRGATDRCANFTGWRQYRATFTSEHPWPAGAVAP